MLCPYEMIEECDSLNPSVEIIDLTYFNIETDATNSILERNDTLGTFTSGGSSWSYTTPGAPANGTYALTSTPISIVDFEVPSTTIDIIVEYETISSHTIDAPCVT